MRKVKFELKYNINGKDTVCGLEEKQTDNNEKYYLLCAVVNGYMREYELRVKSEEGGCDYRFIGPVPDELKTHECEISEMIQSITED